MAGGEIREQAQWELAVFDQFAVVDGVAGQQLSAERAHGQYQQGQAQTVAAQEGILRGCYDLRASRLPPLEPKQDVG